MSVFVYGQTGSGKTYTMFGKDQSNSRIVSDKKHQQTLLNDNVYAGLIPRVLDHLY
jgi:type IV secretory pathway ATPase VirB11/archaellum biosynthesis ATPase